MAVLGCPSPACILDGNGFTQLSVRHGEESLATVLGSNIGMLGFSEDRSSDDSSKDPLKRYYDRVLATRYPQQREDLILRQPDCLQPPGPSADAARHEEDNADGEGQRRQISRVDQDPVQADDGFAARAQKIHPDAVRSHSQQRQATPWSPA